MEVTHGESTSDSSPTAGTLLNDNDDGIQPVEPEFKDVFNQVLANCIAALTVVQVGLNMSYSAVLLPQLEDPASGYNISKNESSWIASLYVLSTPVGSLLSGPVSDRIGRKKGNLLTCILMFLSWNIFVFSPGNGLFGLYIARVIAGLGAGLTTIFIVYCSEISHEKYRPMLLGLNSSAFSLGVLIVTACGVYMHWKTMAACYAVLTVITFILILMFTPESPHWLMMLSKKSNNRNDTEKVLRWLNPNEQIFRRKLQQVLTANRRMEDVRSNQISEANLIKRIKVVFLNFTMRETMLPVIILMGLILFQQLSGGYIIIIYTIHIFQKLGGQFGGGIDEYDALQMMGIIRFIMSVISAGLSRVIGRRPLLFISSFGMAISSGMVTIHQNYFNFSINDLPSNVTLIQKEINTNGSTNLLSILKNETNFLLVNDQSTGHWFPMICVLLFVCFSAVGLLNVPWTMMGELLPTSSRGVGTGFLISFAYVIMFITVKIYPFLLDSINIGTLFLIQGIICFVTIIFTYIFVPETLGKSLNEIEKHFSKKTGETN